MTKTYNYTGFVDKIDGDTVFVRLTCDETGETYFEEFTSQEFKEIGITRRFKYQESYSLEPLPDVEISAEEERAIHEEIERLLGDDNDPQNDY